jgi:hypothetical protein
MMLSSLLDHESPPWQTWVIPAAGLFASLLALFAGRFVLGRRRAARAAPAADGPDPIHDPFDRGSVSERRGTVRREGNPIEVLMSDADAEGEPTRGWVIDRSMGGLCLLLHDEIAPGTVLSLKPRQAPPATPWVRVEVRSCKKERSGYEAGCQFVRTPPWAVLLLFG